MTRPREPTCCSSCHLASTVSRESGSEGCPCVNNDHEFVDRSKLSPSASWCRSRPDLLAGSVRVVRDRARAPVTRLPRFEVLSVKVGARMDP